MRMGIYITGMCLVTFGFFGGFEFMAGATGIETFNTMTKDQVTCIIGATWMVFSGKGASRE